MVADDPLARGGLAAIVRSQGFEVVGPASADEAGRAALFSPRPDLVVWDVGDDVATLTDRLKEWEPEGLPVVALVADEPGAVEALGAGAQGALFRSVEPERLVAALHAAANGLVVLEEAMATALRPRPLAASPPAEALTRRETEVLQLLSLGLSNKEIASRLAVSEHTAKFHVNAILGKLGAQSRTDAVVRAARMGLLIL